jgi:hypothetical protein
VAEARLHVKFTLQRQEHVESSHCTHKWGTRVLIEEQFIEEMEKLIRQKQGYM